MKFFGCFRGGGGGEIVAGARRGLGGFAGPRGHDFCFISVSFIESCALGEIAIAFTTQNVVMNTVFLQNQECAYPDFVYVWKGLQKRKRTIFIVNENQKKIYGEMAGERQ